MEDGELEDGEIEDAETDLTPAANAASSEGKHCEKTKLYYAICTSIDKHVLQDKMIVFFQPES